jgi:hypothetical protein
MQTWLPGSWLRGWAMASTAWKLPVGGAGLHGPGAPSFARRWPRTPCASQRPSLALRRYCCVILQPLKRGMDGRASTGFARLGTRGGPLGRTRGEGRRGRAAGVGTARRGPAGVVASGRPAVPGRVGAPAVARCRARQCAEQPAATLAPPAARGRGPARCRPGHGAPGRHGGARPAPGASGDGPGQRTGTAGLAVLPAG